MIHGIVSVMGMIVALPRGWKLLGIVKIFNNLANKKTMYLEISMPGKGKKTVKHYLEVSGKGKKVSKAKIESWASGAYAHMEYKVLSSLPSGKKVDAQISI
jgi:hypothetical protein